MRLSDYYYVALFTNLAFLAKKATFASTLVKPKLTSLARALQEMGMQAATCLLRQLEGFEPAERILPYSTLKESFRETVLLKTGCSGVESGSL